MNFGRIFHGFSWIFMGFSLILMVFSCIFLRSAASWRLTAQDTLRAITRPWSAPGRRGGFGLWGDFGVLRLAELTETLEKYEVSCVPTQV